MELPELRAGVCTRMVRDMAGRGAPTGANPRNQISLDVKRCGLAGASPYRVNRSPDQQSLSGQSFQDFSNLKFQCSSDPARLGDNFAVLTKIGLACFDGFQNEPGD
jgi:hypothetical protein